MQFWILKVADQQLYPDVPGLEYVYDNRHSTRVQAGDQFVYLDKREGRYCFTAVGSVREVRSRAPTLEEATRAGRVRVVYVAHLCDVLWFSAPVDVSPTTVSGQRTRARLGLPADINALGWSRSMPRISESLFSLLQVAGEGRAVQASTQSPHAATGPSDWSVPDSWGRAKRRRALDKFKEEVLERHHNRCGICGIGVANLLQIAHIKAYAVCIEHRANPANGLCLCAFCHVAYDSGEIALRPDGELLISNTMRHNAIANAHFSARSADDRRSDLTHDSEAFLEERVRSWGILNGATKSKSRRR